MVELQLQGIGTSTVPEPGSLHEKERIGTRVENRVSVFCAVAIMMMMVVAATAPQAVAAMEDFSGFTTGNFYQQIVEFDLGWSPASTTLWGGAFHRMASGIIVDLGGTGGNALELQNVVTGATNPMPSFASPDLGLGNGVIAGGNTTFYYSLRFRSSDDVRPTFASGQGYNINTTIRSQIIPGAGVARSGCLQFRDNYARDAEAGNTYTVRGIGCDTDWVSLPTSTFLPTYGTWYQAFMTYHSNPGFRDDTVDYVIKDELGNTLWSELGQPGWEGA